MIITEKKFRAIAQLKFSRNLRQLKHYLKLTNWLREYIAHYTGINKPFQKKKTKLFRKGFVVDNARRFYTSIIKIRNFIQREIIFFEILQILLSKSSYFIYISPNRRLYINLDTSKEFDFDAMIYYINKF